MNPVQAFSHISFHFSIAAVDYNCRPSLLLLPVRYRMPSSFQHKYNVNDGLVEIIVFAYAHAKVKYVCSVHLMQSL